MKRHVEIGKEIARINELHSRQTGVILEVSHENEGLIIEAKTRAGTFTLAHQMKTGEAFNLARAIGIYHTAQEAHQKVTANALDSMRRQYVEDCKS